MSKKVGDNKVGPWAKDKLEALDRGLEYYTKRLKNQKQWLKIYVDAFAGPSLSEVRQRPKDDIPVSDSRISDLFANTDPHIDPVAEEVEYLKGSPRVALDIKNPFDQYIFVEKDPKRVAELENMRIEYGSSRNIEIVAGDANAALQAMLNRGFSKNSHRAYIFLDPFGIQVPWSTIERLAATNAIEVMINFPLGMGINRMMPVSGNVPLGWGISLDTFFGSPDWRQHVYGKTIDLAGERIEKFRDSEVRLLEWYRERLRLAFGFVSHAKLITNTRGSRLYYLIWAGPREEGLTGADYIMRMTSSKRK